MKDYSEDVGEQNERALATAMSLNYVATVRYILEKIAVQL